LLAADRGNVLVLFGLALVPLVACAGLALDSLRAFIVEDQLQKSLDAAGLAAGRITDTTDLAAEAQQIFASNFASAQSFASLTSLDVTVSEDESTISLSAAATFPTTLTRVFGNEAVSVAASTVINREIRQMELVLVMDNTGSMWGQPIADEKEAAKLLVENVFGEAESHDNLFVGLVPYTATVNIGSQRTAWLDASDNVFLHPELFANSVNDWKGCVMARPTPFDKTDDPPATAPFRSYLYPEAVDNNWTLPFKEAITYRNDGTGPNLGCASPITPLIQSKSTILAAIDQMGAWHRGGTTSNLGLVWGWRVISPRWRGLWGGDTPAERPLDYNAAMSDKVVVLLTDGNNQFYDWPNHQPNNGVGPGGSDVTAFGRLHDLGVATLAAGQDLLDDRMAEMCETMKEEDIILYTITFGAKPDAQTKTLFQNCATTNDYYFHAPDGATLKNVFRTVGRQLSNLRIAH
jgi:Flp pilus assembly protein TadG